MVIFYLRLSPHLSRFFHSLFHFPLVCVSHYNLSCQGRNHQNCVGMNYVTPTLIRN